MAAKKKRHKVKHVAKGSNEENNPETIEKKDEDLTQVRLFKAASDLNRVMGLEPPIDTEKLNQDDLYNEISEVISAIEPEDNFKSDTMSVIEIIRRKARAVAEEEEQREDDLDKEEEGVPIKEEKSVEEEDIEEDVKEIEEEKEEVEKESVPSWAGNLRLKTGAGRVDLLLIKGMGIDQLVERSPEAFKTSNSIRSLISYRKKQGYVITEDEKSGTIQMVGRK